VHSETKSLQYEEPLLPLPPLIPISLLDPITGEQFTPKQLQANESNSSSEFSSDSSFGSEYYDIVYESNIGITELDPKQAPKGAHSELELAKERVLARQRSQVRAKKNR
jgi:hypothetical protein